MLLRKCDFCGAQFPHSIQLNVVSFLGLEKQSPYALTEANPRIELCGECFDKFKREIELRIEVNDDVRKK